jgi:hypothetical protein
MLRLPPQPCPNCGKTLDAAGSFAEGITPDPGDLTICLYCGHFMAFDDDLSFRELTPEEMNKATATGAIKEAQSFRDAFLKEKEAKGNPQ